MQNPGRSQPRIEPPLASPQGKYCNSVLRWSSDTERRAAPFEWAPHNILHSTFTDFLNSFEFIIPEISLHHRAVYSLKVVGIFWPLYHLLPILVHCPWHCSILTYSLNCHIKSDSPTLTGQFESIKSQHCTQITKRSHADFPLLPSHSC